MVARRMACYQSKTAFLLSFSCHQKRVKKVVPKRRIHCLKTMWAKSIEIGLNRARRAALAMINSITVGYGAGTDRRMVVSPAAATSQPADIIGAMSLEQLLDEELVAKYRSGTEVRDRDVYINELFRRNYSRVARWCLRFTSDRESAADLAQEVFSKAYQNLSSFQGQSKFSTWLFVIARNHCLNAVRANTRQATELKADDGEEIL